MSVAGLTREIQTILNEGHRILVVSHVDPDGDAIGTQLAFGHYLRDIGKEVLIVRDSVISSKYLFLPEVDSIIEMESLSYKNYFFVGVILEFPTPDRMGAVAQNN